MTIAAGFVHRDGVLLCADTQHESSVNRLHAKKLFAFGCKFGNLGIAYAGNSAFARAVIQIMQAKLDTLPVNDPLPAIRRIVDKEYRRLVYQHPHFGQDPTLDFGFVFAVQKAGEKVRLYSTEQVAVLESNPYKIIGVGEILGNVLVHSNYLVGMNFDYALLHAVYALGIVKAYVPGCGGLSLMRDIRNDGTTPDYFGDPFIGELEKQMQVEQFHLLALMKSFADVNLPDTLFPRVLDGFKDRMVKAREEMAGSRLRHKQRRTAALPTPPPSETPSEDQSVPKSPTDDQQDPPASQE
jgi:20S proteasome alpha/beta subunit